jgi:hypothetical protein
LPKTNKRVAASYVELFIERAKDVIVSDDKEPVLYDAHDRPLVREIGFRSRA